MIQVITCYKDDSGKIHEDMDSAISANLDNKVLELINQYTGKDALLNVLAPINSLQLKSILKNQEFVQELYDLVIQNKEVSK